MAPLQVKYIACLLLVLCTLTTQDEIVCERALGSLSANLTIADHLGASQLANESLGSILRDRPDGVGAATPASVWAYIGDLVTCTVHSATHPTANRYNLKFTTYTLNQRKITSPEGSSFGDLDTVASGLEAISENQQTFGIVLDNEDEEVFLNQGETVDLPGGRFSIKYPLSKMGGELNKGRAQFSFSVSVTAYAVDASGVETTVEINGGVEIQYFFGVPESIGFKCAENTQPHAWSATLTSLAQFSAGPAINNATEIKNGSLLLCQIRAQDFLGNTVLVDPFYTTTFEASALNITVSETYCGVYRSNQPATIAALPSAVLKNFFLNTPRFNAVGGGALLQQDTSSTFSTCSNLYGKGRRVIADSTSGSGTEYAPAVDFFANRVRPLVGENSTYEMLAEVTLEPFDYGHIEISVSFKTTEGVLVEEKQEVDFGGAVTGLEVSCKENGLEPQVIILDPEDLKQTCEIIPTMATDAAFETELTSVEVVSFLESIVIEPYIETDTQYVSVLPGSVSKVQVPADFAEWQEPDTPGFEFEFELSPQPQPNDFDTKTVAFRFYWKRSLPLNASTVSLDGEVPLLYEKRLVATKSFLVAYKPVPELSFLCNTVPCDDGLRPGVLSQVGFDPVVYDALVVNVATHGVGVHSDHFNRNVPQYCWYKGAAGQVDPTCLTSISAAETLPSLRISSPDTSLYETQDGNVALLTLRVTYGYNLSVEQFTTTAEKSLRIVTNNFDVGSGRAQSATKTLVGAGRALVFCEDFDDSDKPLQAWVTAEEVDLATAAEGAEAVQSAAEFLASDVVDDFEEASAGDAAQMSELIFQSTQSTGLPVDISLVNAKIVQEAHDYPSDGGEAAFLIDQDVTTSWKDYLRKPVVIVLEKPMEVDSFTMVTSGDAVRNDVTQWRLEGALRLGHWTTLHDQTFSYLVPVERQETLPSFDFALWTQKSGTCDVSTCIEITRYIDADTAPFLKQDITDLQSCKWACERQLGCSHINWSDLKITCQMMSCKRDATSPVIAAGVDTCHEFSNMFKYLRFTPMRIREAPIPVYLSNPHRVSIYFRVRCMLADAKGALVASHKVDYVEVQPHAVMKGTTDADAQILGWQEQLNTQTTIPHLFHLLKQVKESPTASAVAKLSFTEVAFSLALAELEGGAGVINASVARLQLFLAVVHLAAEVTNIEVTTHDTTIDETMRDRVNSQLSIALNFLVVRYERLVYPEVSISFAIRTVNILVGALELKKEMQQTTDTLLGYKEDADNLLAVVTYIAKNSLRQQETGTCASCAQCAAHGVHTHACRQSAYLIPDSKVSPELGYDFNFLTSKYVFGNGTRRYNLASIVVLSAYTLPKYPRTYLNDNATVRGRVMYVSLITEEDGVSRIAPVNATDMNVTVVAEPTQLSQVPLQIRQRQGSDFQGMVRERWAADPFCLAESVVSNVTEKSILGLVASTCTVLKAETATEFATVSTLMSSRCISSDMYGCLSVENADAPHEDCRCQQCSTDFFNTPSPSGKYCVPYKTYSCESEPDTLLALDEQCTGNSIRKYGKCVCQPDMVCSDEVCEQKHVCGATGSEGQCKLSGLLHDAEYFKCLCKEGSFCKVDVANPERSLCIEKSTCASLQTVASEEECHHGSVFAPSQGRCVCDRYHYCSTTGVCAERFKCDETPPQADAALCWPATSTQPQLVLLPVTTNGNPTYTCRCPSTLTCNTTLQACTCPDCVYGTCDYADDEEEWIELDHNCTCPEGRVGADCSRLEPTTTFFVETRFERGIFTETLSGAVPGIVEATLNESLYALQASDIKRVYIENGSIAVRIEVSTFNSTWQTRVRDKLQQDRYASRIAAALVSAGASGEIEDGAIQHFDDSCTHIAQCTSTPRPWADCTCQECNPTYVLSSDRLECFPDALCSSVEHCNGRGVATGLVVNGCTCDCATNFDGLQCEIDLCLSSLAMWLDASCGVQRCGYRTDGDTLVGTLLGECVSPDSAPLTTAAIVLVVLSGLLIVSLVSCGVYWGFKHRCVWEKRRLMRHRVGDGLEEEDVLAAGDSRYATRQSAGDSHYSSGDEGGSSFHTNTLHSGRDILSGSTSFTGRRGQSLHDSGDARSSVVMR